MTTALKTIEIDRTTVEKVLATINSCLKQAVVNLKRVGELYVEAIDKDFRMKQIIQEAIRDISPSTWARFELIGRGRAIAELVYDESGPARRLVRCPESDQRKYVSEPIPLLVGNNGDTLPVFFHSMTKEQTQQVFASDHVRDLREQKAWLIQRKKDFTEKETDFTPEPPSFVIVGKKVRFRRDVELTRRQIADILARLS